MLAGRAFLTIECLSHGLWYVHVNVLIASIHSWVWLAKALLAKIGLWSNMHDRKLIPARKHL